MKLKVAQECCCARNNETKKKNKKNKTNNTKYTTTPKTNKNKETKNDKQAKMRKLLKFEQPIKSRTKRQNTNKVRDDLSSKRFTWQSLHDSVSPDGGANVRGAFP
jgi:hypothetical protein